MNSRIHHFFKEHQLLLIATAAFIAWGLAFIYHSSYAASDGKRYFNLFDDAMISMRYAWNAAHGNGLVWNAGEYVEGYTNLLMTLLMSLAALLFEKRYAVLAVQLTGVVFVPATAYFTWKTFQLLRSEKPGFASTALFVLVLLYYPLNFWSLMGMETGLLAVLISAGVYHSLNYAAHFESRSLWWMSICFGLAHLTRNESILFAAIAFAYLVPSILSDKTRLREFIAAGMLYGLFVIGQLSFRYFYYGELVPNTYTLKLTGMPLDERLRNGLGFVQPYLKETSLFILIALAGVLFKFTKEKTYLFLLYLTSVAYQIYVGGDSWNYWRIMTPLMPLLFILFIEACLHFPAKTSLSRSLMIGALSLAALYLADARFLPQFSLLELPYQNNYARAHVEAAIALNELTDDGATIGVFWAGSLPYYLDRKAIDFLGKSDKYVASLPPDLTGQSAGFGMNSIPGHNKHDLGYSIQTLLPTYVEEFDYGLEKLSGWGEDHYVRIKYGDAKLYLLKDSPHVKWDKVKDYLDW